VQNNELSKTLAGYPSQVTANGNRGLSPLYGSYSAAVESLNLPYQKIYPSLYARKSMKSEVVAIKTIYLTFDDGPSSNTLEILDTLESYNVKATFFVIYNDDEASKNMYREIVRRGHTIAIHSASHKYSEIYKSVENYLADFDKIYNQIVQVTGVKPDLFRFPGGSINPYNVHIHQEIIAEMLRRGFTYHDWNVSAGDLASNATRGSVYASVVQNAKKHNKSIVLLHDRADKNATVLALEDIIVDLQASGYFFAKLDGSVMPFTFAYK
jgi:peptidoglycan/xylan/chitin deacetylase (PgdA/CDA1 family)